MGTNDQAIPKPVEEQAHVFVVKFWQEVDTGQQVFWRGHITHIPTNVRASVQNMAQLRLFLERYIHLPEAE
jgi:hypothetical protein